MEYTDNIPATYLKEIGAISVNAARLEFAMLYCIVVLNCADFQSSDFPATVCLVGGETFDILLSKLTKLFRLKVKDPSLRAKFDGVALSLRKVNVDRNTYLHSHLSVEKHGKVVRLKFRKKMNEEDSLADGGDVSVTGLRSLATKAFTVGNDLFNVIMQNLDTIYAGYNSTNPGIPHGKTKPN
jgi:hypothetical protein